MTKDGELETWRRQWRGGSRSAVDTDAAERLRQRVLNETRGIKLGLLVPILVTLLAGGAVLASALRTGQSLDILLAVESWIFIVVVWSGSLWIARGTWRPLAETTAAYLEVSIRRREACCRGATFGASLYVVQLLIMVLAIAAASPGGISATLTSGIVILVGWIGVPSIVAALFWFRARQLADLERLRELERQLRSD